MSLLVWLPLNGDLKNYGLSKAKFSLQNSSNGLTFSSSGGKVSSAMCRRTTANTADYIKSDIKFKLENDFSMACWCKATIPGDSSSANGVLTNHNHADNSGSGITLKYISATDCRISCNTGDGTNRTYHTYYGTTNIYDAWHHLCLTYNKATTTYNLYVDGICEKTFTYDNFAAENTFNLFDWSVGYSSNANYRPVCDLNDVRLYDHCLSPKEIKEISFGLIAHYPLRDKYFEKATNLAPYPTPGSSATSSYEWDQTLHADAISVGNSWGVGYNGGVTNPSIGYHAQWQLIDNIPTIVFNNLNSTIGQTRRWLGISRGGLQSHFSTGLTYTISMEVKGSVPNMQIGTGIHYNNGTSTGFHDGCLYKVIPTDWTKMSWTYTVSGTVNTAANASIYIYGHQGAEGTSYVRNIQLELNDHATAYVSPLNGYLFNSKIKDCSGNNYDLDIVGDQIHSLEDSIRNTSCIEIPNGQASYLKNDSVFFPTEHITMNCWFKSDNGITGYGNYHIPFASQSGYFEISIESGGLLRSGLYVNGARSVLTTSSKNVCDGQWHMLSMTYDGATIKRYVDGEMVSGSSTTISGTLSGGNKLLTIGHYGTNNGYGNKQSCMSDVRLYATALSDADILNLYQTSVSIDNLQNIHTYEFIENDINNFKKDGTVNFELFTNDGDKCSIFDSLLTSAYFIEI